MLSDNNENNKPIQAVVSAELDSSSGTTENSSSLSSLDALSVTEGGIEFLIQLAERGEIDPADVDIVEVADRFLKAIAAAPKENLRQSGKVLFHASVLLRLKAESLLDNKDNIGADAGDDFLDFDSENGLIYDSLKRPIARQITLYDLEKALIRRANNRQNRQKKVTLDQLVMALKDAEKIERARSERIAKPRIQLAGYHEVNDVDDILDLAHDEDIEVVIGKVDQILAQRLSIGDTLDLLDLIILLGTRQGKKIGAKHDWVDAFLAILFLSNAGKIVLEQTSFYGPLQIVRCELPPPLEMQVSA